MRRLHERPPASSCCISLLKREMLAIGVEEMLRRVGIALRSRRAVGEGGESLPIRLSGRLLFLGGRRHQRQLSPLRLPGSAVQVEGEGRPVNACVRETGAESAGATKLRDRRLRQPRRSRRQRHESIGRHLRAEARRPCQRCTVFRATYQLRCARGSVRLHDALCTRNTQTCAHSHPRANSGQTTIMQSHGIKQRQRKTKCQLSCVADPEC